MKFIKSILQYSNDAIFYRHGSFDLISVIGQDKGCIFCGKSIYNKKYNDKCDYPKFIIERILSKNF